MAINKLIKKLKRREAYMNHGLNRFRDKTDRSDVVLNDSPALYKMFRRIARKMSASFNQGLLPSEQLKLETKISIDDLDRHDFGSSDFGIRMRSDGTAGVNEVTQIVAIADTGAFEISLITCVAFASTAQGDYFIFEAPDASKYAVWLDKDANGTAPTGAAYVAAAHKIKASIITGNTATQVRDAVLAAIGTIANMSIASTSTNQITITAQTFVNRTNTAGHNTGDTGAGSFTVATSQGGAASVLNNTYFMIHGLTQHFYVWMNCNSIGTDPMLAGKTGIAVSIAAPATNAQVGLAVKTALDAMPDFVASNASQTVTCTVQEKEAEADATDGAVPTGFAISVTAQGVTGAAQADFASIGMQPGDVIELLEGANKGTQLKVIQIVDPLTVRLEDKASFGSSEADILAKAKIAGNKKSFS